MTQILAIQGAPATTDFDSGRHIFGNDFSADSAGTITGVWYYHTSVNEPTEVTVLVHRQSNQALLESKNTATAGLTDNTWNLITLDDPVVYDTPDELITISASWPSGGFVYTLDATEHSADGLTAMVDDVGRFKNAGAAETDYPSSSFGGIACPVGMEFEADEGAETVTGVSAVALGGLSGTATGIRTVLGTTVAAVGALGQASSGLRTVLGTSACSLGSVSATSAGLRKVPGTAAVTLGGLSTVIAGTRVGQTVTGAAVVGLGGLTVQASGGLPAPAEAGGSWYGLLSILAEARAMYEQQKSAVPVACPDCGEPLRSAQGVLHCSFDGWVSR